MDSSIIGALIKVDDIEEIFLLLTLLLDSNDDQAAEQEEFEYFLTYPKNNVEASKTVDKCHKQVGM